jgi:hypothetical protein
MTPPKLIQFQLWPGDHTIINMQQMQALAKDDIFTNYITFQVDPVLCLEKP